jgi:hypothetical protein
MSLTQHHATSRGHDTRLEGLRSLQNSGNVVHVAKMVAQNGRLSW